MKEKKFEISIKGIFKMNLEIFTIIMFIGRVDTVNILSTLPEGKISKMTKKILMYVVLRRSVPVITGVGS